MVLPLPHTQTHTHAHTQFSHLSIVSVVCVCVMCVFISFLHQPPNKHIKTIRLFRFSYNTYNTRIHIQTRPTVSTVTIAIEPLFLSALSRAHQEKKNESGWKWVRDLFYTPHNKTFAKPRNGNKDVSFRVVFLQMIHVSEGEWKKMGETSTHSQFQCTVLSISLEVMCMCTKRYARNNLQRQI